MKNASLLLFFYLSFFSLNAQITANAGIDQHACPGDTLILGANPTASGGAEPYEYEWWIKPIKFVPGSGIPFLYASDILNDTTAANPAIIDHLEKDSIVFYVKVKDQSGNSDIDSCLITFSSFYQHLGQSVHSIMQGDSVFLNNQPNISGGFGELTYEWFPAHGLRNRNRASGFWAKPDSSVVYYAQVTDSKSCKYKGGGFYIVYVNPLSIHDHAKATEFRVFPNPNSNGILNLQLDDQEKIINVELFSLQGKFLKSYNPLLRQLDISQISPGSYILVIKTEKEVISRSFLKN